MMSSATSASPITVSNVSLGLYVEMAALRVIVSRHSSMVPGTQAPSLPSSAGNEQPDWAPMTQSQPSMSAVHGVVEPAPEVVEMNGEDVVEMNAEATAATPMRDVERAVSARSRCRAWSCSVVGRRVPGAEAQGTFGSPLQRWNWSTNACQVPSAAIGWHTIGSVRSVVQPSSMRVPLASRTWRQSIA